VKYNRKHGQAKKPKKSKKPKKLLDEQVIETLRRVNMRTSLFSFEIALLDLLKMYRCKSDVWGTLVGSGKEGQSEFYSRSSFSLIFYIYNIDVGKASDRVGDAVNSAALAFEGSEMSLVLLAVTLC
jgi:hypothetical protein